MRRVNLAAFAATLLIAGSAALMPPALAAPPSQAEVQEMLKKSGTMRSDGMVTKQDFMKMMEKRFDAMDKQKKGMVSAEDIAKILDPSNYM
jgi:Ca2+-binding EF-hand superfamily protein